MSPSASDHFGWGKALRIAWREARSSTGRFVFVVLAAGVGVGALTGVRGFSEAFRGMLLREARTLMAADLMVRTFEFPTPEQTAAIDSLQSQGVRRTWVTETVSMVSSGPGRTPVLVVVKAVDPLVYPFYGTVKLDPEGPLARAVGADSVAVSEDLLLRLDARVGDRIRLGSELFRVAAIVRVEPDRMTGSVNVGPRLMVSREGLERAGLIQVGSRASQRHLFRLAEKGPSVEAVRTTLQAVFPGTLIADFRQTHPLITRGLNRATTFLSLVSLIALIVGALGVAMAMHSHLQQRMDTIAVMKCLGARSGQIMRIYLAQTLLLGLLGGMAGVLLGSGVQATFPHLIDRYFHLRPAQYFDIWPAVQGLALGVLATLLLTLPPLLAIRHVRPAIIFRRNMAEAKPSRRQRWVRFRSSLVAAGAILGGVGLMAAWLAGGSIFDAARTSGYFIGALVAGVAVLSGIAWLLLTSLRLFVRRTSWGLPVTLRHGMSNLYRPGNQAQAVLVALGVGVMFTLTVFLVQRGLLEQFVASAPPDMPNVFLVNITDREHAGLLSLLGRQAGVEGTPEIVASVPAKLEAVDGTPTDQLRLEGWSRRFLRTRSITWRATKPIQTEVLDGSWWESRPASPQVCVAEHAARTLGIKTGSRVEWSSGGRLLVAEVACVHRSESVRFGGSMDFVFSSGALDGLPVMYFGALRMRAASVPVFQKAAFERYPTVTVINGADVLEIVQEVVDQIALVVRFVSFFAILAGVVILASTVAGTRFRRMRETAVLKTLGATRRRVAAIFSVEFLLLGAVAGLMGSLLASGFSSLLLRRLLEAPFHFDLWPNALSVILTALVANAAGWFASYRILGQKPLEVLRGE